MSHQLADVGNVLAHFQYIKTTYHIYRKLGSSNLISQYKENLREIEPKLTVCYASKSDV